MRYVCDLWFQDGNKINPYGMFFFEYGKFPTQQEVNYMVMDKLPLLQSDKISHKSITVSTIDTNPQAKHYVGINFGIYSLGTFLLYATNIRPVVEDTNSELNLYT